MKDEELKSVRTAYLFWLVGLCGCLGVHRMYLGKRRTARLWLCTAGVLGLGALADALLLGWLVRRHNCRAQLRTLHRRLEETARRKREAIDAQLYPEAAPCATRKWYYNATSKPSAGSWAPPEPRFSSPRHYVISSRLLPEWLLFCTFNPR